MEEMKARDGISLNTIVTLALKVYFHMNKPKVSLGNEIPTKEVER